MAAAAAAIEASVRHEPTLGAAVLAVMAHCVNPARPDGEGTGPLVLLDLDPLRTYDVPEFVDLQTDCHAQLRASMQALGDNVRSTVSHPWRGQRRCPWYYP